MGWEVEKNANFLFAFFSVVRRLPCRPAAVPIAGRTMPTRSRLTFKLSVLCPTADVNKTPSQFRSWYLYPQTPPIRAAYRRLGQAAKTKMTALLPQDPPTKLWLISGQTPQDPPPLTINAGRRVLETKAFILKATAKALKRSPGAQDFCRGEKSLMLQLFNL